MRSSTSSNTATVVTVNRRSTEVLSSLETSVDGEVIITSVRVRPTSAPASIDTSRIDVSTMTSRDIAQIAIFVHQLLEANASTSRAHGALSRRWLSYCVVTPSGAVPIHTTPRYPRFALGGEQ